jgi:serine/threonine-protein kinase
MPPGNDRSIGLDDPLIGRLIAGQYQIVRKLGEGGIGGVYSALHLPTGRRVALKVLLPELMGTGEVSESFLEEARTVSLTGHENVIDIFYGRISEEDGYAFLAMEYLTGTDLAHVLRYEGPMPWPRARNILLQVTDALDAVHRHGIIHRDIKPGNIFLVSHGAKRDAVKLLDFGIARVTTSRYRTDNQDVANAPVSGTPQYMAPEQAMGQPVDRRADVYSLGCVMYHMLTGGVPFTAELVIDLMAKHCYEPPEPPRARRPDLEIPPGVETVILRAMEKDPALRFATAAEMGEAIFRCRFTGGGGVPHAGGAGGQFRLDDPAVRRR